MRSPRFFYLAFFVTGIATASTSALVALHGVSALRSDSEIGRLIAAQFSGQLIGSFFVRRNVSSRLLLGALVTSIAATSLAVLHGLSVPLLFVYGLGLGLSMAAINTLTGLESPPQLCARRLELLNIFWPLGAATCPWLLARIPQGAPGWPAPLVVCFGVLAALFLVIALGTALRTRSARPATGSAPANALEEDSSHGSSFPLLLSLLALVTVGVESGVANWLPTFQFRYLPSASLFLPLATLFWSSILVSRLLASRWLNHRSERSVVLIASLAFGVCIAGLMLFHAPFLLACATIAAAAFIAPVYPLLLTRTIRLRGRGLVFFCASAGSALFPWLIGKCATISNSLRTGMLVALAGTMLLFLISCFRLFAPTPEEPSSTLPPSRG